MEFARRHPYGWRQAYQLLMQFSLLIQGSPTSSQSPFSAYEFAAAALEQGHSIQRAFFYQDAVLIGNKLVATPQDEFDIQKVLTKEVKKEQLSEVRIKSIQLGLSDSAAPVPNSFTVLLASPNTSMKECGFIQEESIKSNDYNVSLANEQEFLEEILQDKMQTLVIDFDLKEDWFDDYTVTAVINWELKFKN